MPSYRQKPIFVDAWQINYDDYNEGPLPDWVMQAFNDGYLDGCGDGESLYISTPIGLTSGRMGEWVVKNEAGDFYPFSPENFAATYELVE